MTYEVSLYSHCGEAAVHGHATCKALMQTGSSQLRALADQIDSSSPSRASSCSEALMSEWHLGLAAACWPPAHMQIKTTVTTVEPFVK